MCIAPPPDLHSYNEKLLKNGADPHMQKSGNGVSAIFTALILKLEGVAVDRIAAHPTIGPRVVRALVAGGADINDMTFASAYSPLHVACIEGACAEVIQELLDLGADLDVPCVSANSLAPLHLAAGFGGNLGAIRLLMGLPHSGGLNAVAPPPNDRSSTGKCWRRESRATRLIHRCRREEQGGSCESYGWGLPRSPLRGRSLRALFIVLLPLLRSRVSLSIRCWWTRVTVAPFYFAT